MRHIVQALLALNLALIALWIPPPVPTPLEVQHHHGCGGWENRAEANPLVLIPGLPAYLKCLMGGRHNGPISDVLLFEHHTTYAHLTDDDMAEIRADHYAYICQPGESCTP